MSKRRKKSKEFSMDHEPVFDPFGGEPAVGGRKRDRRKVKKSAYYD